MSTKLQILIVAYGLDDGILSLHQHPRMDDVEYIVSWQRHDMERLPKELTARPDFKIFPSDTVGISRNRNEAFSHATADHVLLSDADLIYTEEYLSNILRAFEENPDMSILTFRYYSRHFPKNYPDREFSLNGRHPKGYSITSFEIGFNLKKIRGDYGSLADLHFNPCFGINGSISQFICGEEDILIAKLLRKGYPGKYLPLIVTEHPESTTSMRVVNDPNFIATKGACVGYSHPWSWPLRMIAHAWRSHRSHGSASLTFRQYCAYWLNGMKLARLNHVFYEE